MSSLERRYRAAPMRHSPAHLDDAILARARAQLPDTGHRSTPPPRSSWLPWAASLSVACLCAAVALRLFNSTGNEPYAPAADRSDAGPLASTSSNEAVSGAKLRRQQGDAASTGSASGGTRERSEPVQIALDSQAGDNEAAVAETASDGASGAAETASQAGSSQLPGEPAKPRSRTVVDDRSAHPPRAPVTTEPSTVHRRFSNSESDIGSRPAAPAIEESALVAAPQEQQHTRKAEQSRRREPGADHDTNDALQWLYAQPPDHHTLQIARGASVAELRKVAVDADLNLQYIRIVPAPAHADGPLLLLYGIFQTARQARSEARALQSRLNAPVNVLGIATLQRRH